MSNGYLRVSGDAPVMVVSAPQCLACNVDLVRVCPGCGTAWPSDAGDGEVGEPYASWSGEEPDGPEVTPAEAWRVAHLSGDDRTAALRRIRGEVSR